MEVTLYDFFCDWLWRFQETNESFESAESARRGVKGGSMGRRDEWARVLELHERLRRKRARGSLTEDIILARLKSRPSFYALHVGYGL
jgi:hypothetical protein